MIRATDPETSNTYFKSRGRARPQWRGYHRSAGLDMGSGDRNVVCGVQQVTTASSAWITWKSRRTCAIAMCCSPQVAPPRSTQPPNSSAHGSVLSTSCAFTVSPACGPIGGDVVKHFIKVVAFPRRSACVHPTSIVVRGSSTYIIIQCSTNLIKLSMEKPTRDGKWQISNTQKAAAFRTTFYLE